MDDLVIAGLVVGGIILLPSLLGRAASAPAAQTIALSGDDQANGRRGNRQDRQNNAITGGTAGTQVGTPSPAAPWSPVIGAPSNTPPSGPGYLPEHYVGNTGYVVGGTSVGVKGSSTGIGAPGSPAAGNALYNPAGFGGGSGQIANSQPGTTTYVASSQPYVIVPSKSASGPLPGSNSPSSQMPGSKSGYVSLGPSRKVL